MIEAARALGIAAATAQRNLDRMRRAVLGKADRLIEQIEYENAQQAPKAEEIRLLNTARHIVLADMVKQLS